MPTSIPGHPIRWLHRHIFVAPDRYPVGKIGFPIVGFLTSGCDMLPDLMSREDDYFERLSDVKELKEAILGFP